MSPRPEDPPVPALLAPTRPAEAAPDPAPTPADVLQAVYARHRAGWAAMVRLRLGGPLLRRVDPDDVLQQAWVRARRRQGRFADWAGRPRTRPEDWDRMAYYWLNRLVANTLRDTLRNQLAARRDAGRCVAVPDRSAEQFACGLFAALPTPSTEFVRRELRQRVRDTIAGLKPEDQEILWLRSLWEFTTDEVAAALGLEEAAVRKRHGRGLRRFTEAWLARYGSGEGGP